MRRDHFVPAYKVRAQRRASESRWKAAERHMQKCLEESAELQAKTKALQQPDCFVLPAGTVCKRNGIPFELVTKIVIRCHPETWPAIRDEFVPTVNGVAVERGYDPTLLRSQSEHSPAMFRVAQSGPTSMTSNLSLESSAGLHKSRT